MSEVGQLTPDQWRRMGKQLEQFLTRVELAIDGFNVTLSLQRAGQFHNAIVVYVDGLMRGEWLLSSKDTEQGRRFFPTRERYLWSNTKRKDAIKHFGKRRARQLGFFQRISHRDAVWRSFTALKRHLLDNNDSIEWTNEPAATE